jgi:hypothetical protein
MFRLRSDGNTELNQRMGETFRRLDQMSTDYAFWLTDELKDFAFTARVHGLGSERLAVYIDGQRLGAAALHADKTEIITISGRELSLKPGRHKLTLALSRPRGGSPEAEVSWVRLGPRSQSQLIPATHSEMFSEVKIGEKGHRGIILRPGASLRCPVWVPQRAQFKTDLAIWGEGAAEAEVLLHTQTGQRIVIAEHVREADKPRDFSEFRADLSPFASQFVDLELSAPAALERSRVVFGRPRIQVEEAPQQTKTPAKRAIVVVFSGLSDRHTPPASAESGLPFFNQLARDSAIYSGYRASTTSVPGVIASLLTGLPPWIHGVENMGDELPRAAVTLAATVEAQGGRSAFFTAVPLSFAPFGFDRGFAKFENLGPQEDRAATEPIELAKKWLGSHLKNDGPLLLVLHLRGGHPPFDISREAAMELAPKEYGGDLTPRRAAIQLSEIRSRRLARHQQMPEEDWTRLESMQKAALLKQSVALSGLLTWLQKRDAYDDTLIVALGDVGAGARPSIPFSTKADLSETVLTPPLLIKFPGGHLRGERIKAPYDPTDVAAEVANALSLNREFSGASSLSQPPADGTWLRPHLAYRNGAYSMLFGSFLLVGTDGHPPKLCQPALDPYCHEDRSESHPLEARTLWLWAYQTLTPSLSEAVERKSKSPPDKEPNPFFENALTTWGVDP